jgi:hypothetical protein
MTAVSITVKMLVVFWIMRPCSIVAFTNVSEHPIRLIFRVYSTQKYTLHDKIKFASYIVH